MTKTYWQAMDKDGETYLFHDKKPRFDDGFWGNNGGNFYSGILFPIPLKPLQIATITVNDNGTWTWEIEREEGWYMARWSDKIDTPTGRKTVLIEYKNSEYSFSSGTKISASDLAELTISHTRIPDECII